MSNESPASVLFDADGNPVEIIVDADGQYRVATDSLAMLRGEDGNAVATVEDADGDYRLAVDSAPDPASTRMANQMIVEELRKIRREMKAIRLHFEEMTEYKITSVDVDSEEPV